MELKNNRLSGKRIIFILLKRGWQFASLARTYGKEDTMITRVKDVPVTHGELKAVNKQLSSLKIALDKGFSSVEKRFQSIDKKFDSIDKKFDSLMDHMDFRFSQQSAEIQRWLAIYEEQNARNKVVMDSQGLVQHKFEEYDSRISSLEEKVFGIKNK